MKVKLNEFKYAMTAAINETVDIAFPKILEDKEFVSICERSITHGTLHPQHVSSALLNFLKNEHPEVYSEFIAKHPNMEKAIENENDPYWDSEEGSYDLNDDLFNTMNSVAPEGEYFGSHPGDGSDFGFWKNEEEANTDEVLQECAVQFTTGVFEEMNITKERVDEIAFLAPWIGKLAISALRPLITRMLAKYGAKFFASTAGKAILRKIGCKTAAQALGKLGIKTAGKTVAKKAADKAAGKAAGTVGKKFGDTMLGKAAKWTGYTLAGNAIMGGGSKNDNNVSSTYEPSSDYNYNYSYAAEAIERVFNRHFSE